MRQFEFYGAELRGVYFNNVFFIVAFITLFTFHAVLF